MSLLRQDPTTKEWVILAGDRAGRPHERTGPRARRASAHHESSCPFCPGNEARTPPETLRVRGAAAEWSVRVVPNAFPVLAPRGELARRELEPIYLEMDGVGYHEVIIESPTHDATLWRMPNAAIESVLSAYRARFSVLRGDPRVQCIVIFKNHGERAGTSLTHPHSQLVATPVAPRQLRTKYDVAIAHYDATGRCLYCDLVEAERCAASRVVLETERFLVFEPFASQVPFETWIAPKRHQPSFHQITDGDLAALADVLRRTLGTLDAVLDDPDFNYVVRSAPVGDEGRPYYLWHIAIVPRLTTPAGFELGSGISVSTMLPEDSAARLRAGLKAAA